MIKREDIGYVIEFMYDHYRNFNGFAMDIEIDGKIYDLSPVIDSIFHLEESEEE